MGMEEGVGVVVGGEGELCVLVGVNVVHELVEEESVPLSGGDVQGFV